MTMDNADQILLDQFLSIGTADSDLLCALVQSAYFLSEGEPDPGIPLRRAALAVGGLLAHHEPALLYRMQFVQPLFSRAYEPPTFHVVMHYLLDLAVAQRFSSQIADEHVAALVEPWTLWQAVVKAGTERKTCPQCGEEVRERARSCRYCAYRFRP
jgi:hypothetical protein